jgi:ATP-dependent DNA helicase RecG
VLTPDGAVQLLVENLVKIEFYKLRDAGFLEMVPGLKGPKSAWQLTELGKVEIERRENR